MPACYLTQVIQGAENPLPDPFNRRIKTILGLRAVEAQHFSRCNSPEQRSAAGGTTMNVIKRLGIACLGSLVLIHFPSLAEPLSQPVGTSGQEFGAIRLAQVQMAPIKPMVAKPLPMATGVAFSGCLKPGSQFSVNGRNMNQGAVCATDCKGKGVKSNKLSANSSQLRCDVQGQLMPGSRCGIGAKMGTRWLQQKPVTVCGAALGAMAPAIRPPPPAGMVPPGVQKTPRAPTVAAPSATMRAPPAASRFGHTAGAIGTARLPSGSVEIVSFRRYQEGTHAQLLAPSAVVSGSTSSSTIRIDAGERITVRWTIRACHVRDIQAEISGIGPINPGSSTQINPNCVEMTNTRGFTPAMDAREIVMTATATSTAGMVGMRPRDSKRLGLEVRSARLSVLEPEINQETMGINFYITNDGNIDLPARPIQFSYAINRSGGGSLMSDMITTSALVVPRGGRVQVASVTLPDRAEALSTNGITMSLRAGANYARSADTAHFEHEWDVSTYELSSGLVNLGLGLEVRMNNQRPGTSRSEDSRPMINDDSWIRVLSLSRSGGWDQQDLVFSPPYIGGGGSGYYFFMNNLEAVRARNEFFIRDGQFGIRIVFDTHREREVKGWRHTVFGPYNDDLAPDINIGTLEIEVMLTPMLRSGRISYSTVTTNADIRITGWAGGWRGTGEFLDWLANVNNYIENLARTSVRSNIQAMLGYDAVRTNIENAIADGLTTFGMDTGRIVSVRGAGDRIIISYLR
jgi:hypothetical protein